ncbi:hypothetical protein RI367_005205 [Sorochytrium milnesiophthora]
MRLTPLLLALLIALASFQVQASFVGCTQPNQQGCTDWQTGELGCVNFPPQQSGHAVDSNWYCVGYAGSNCSGNHYPIGAFNSKQFKEPLVSASCHMCAPGCFMYNPEP